MNMKKSIAGVMAGAMAVSAMATTASAWTGGNADHEQIEYVYDLATYGISYSAAEVKVVMNFTKKDALYYVEGSKNIKNADKTSFSKDVVVGANFNACSSFDLAKVVITGTTTDDATTVEYKYDANGRVIIDPDTGLPEQVRDPFTRTMKYYDKTFIGLPSDGSNENINIADSAAATGLKDASGNQYAYQIQFAHSNVKKDYGAFILDNFAREDDTTTTEWVPGTVTEKTGWKVVAYNTVTGANEIIGYYEKEADALADKAAILTVKKYDKVIADEFYTTSLDAEGNTIYSYNVVGYTTEGNKVTSTVSYNTKLVDKTNGTPDDTTDDLTVAQVNEKAAEEAAALARAKCDAMLKETKYRDSVVSTAKWTVDNNDGYNQAVKVFKGYAFDTYTVEMTYYVMTEGDWNVTGWTGVVTSASAGIEGLNGAVPVVNFAGGTRSYYAKPMRTTLTEPGNVISQLMAKKMQHAWDEQYYTYPLAVLNDMVANEENVEFVFTTAKGYVDVRDYVEVLGASEVNGKMRVKAYNPSGALTVVDIAKDKVIVRNGKTYADNKALGWYGISYKDGNLNGKGGNGVNSDKSWYHPYFSQHLYNTGTYGSYYFTTQGPNGTETTYDQFGSYSSAWNTNLFNSGLVFNSKWTMQLSDTDAFEWGDDYVVFHWDAAKEGKISVADFYIESMLMYTPVEWYWDTLKVAIGESMVYSVEAGAGEDGDGEVVTEVSEEPIEVEVEEPEEDFGEEDFGDEDFGEEDFGEEDFGEEDFGDEDFGDEDFGDEDFGDEDFTEETEPEETEPEQEVVVVVESPKTGNSSVALAVIPVALAAAAIVAKKRK